MRVLIAVLTAIIFQAHGDEKPFAATECDVHFRPPLQTDGQKAGRAAVTKNSHANSLAKKDWVMQQLEAGKDEFKGTKLEGRTKEQLLEILDWEFQRLQVFHNAPFNKADDKVFDDSYLPDVANNGFVPNVCQYWSMMRGGNVEKCQTGASHQYNQCVQFSDMFHVEDSYNTWKDKDYPTPSESNNCILFLANNMDKIPCGSFAYGSVSYALNVQRFPDLFAWVACDTGHCYQLAVDYRFGTATDYYATLAEAVDYSKVSVASFLKRWTDPSNTPPVKWVGKNPSQKYMEVELYGTLKIPEVLSFVVGTFDGAISMGRDGSGTWGTDEGDKLRKWMKSIGRPLLWSHCDDTPTMVIDPFVGNTNQNFSDSDIKYFKDNWSNTDWKSFYDEAPNAMKFRYLTYFEKEKCAAAEQDKYNTIIGINGNDECVYFKWEEATKWEMLNNGACEKLDPKTNPGRYKIFDSEDDCKKYGKKWKKVSNKIDGRVKHGAPTYTTDYCEASGDGGDFDCKEKCECPKGRTCECKDIPPAPPAPPALQGHSSKLSRDSSKPPPDSSAPAGDSSTQARDSSKPPPSDSSPNSSPEKHSKSSTAADSDLLLWL